MSEEKAITERYLQDVFKGYYRVKLARLSHPNVTPEREFAFFPFDANIVKRHIGFPSQDHLLTYLKRTPPKHAYYSTAYFGRPDAERMDEKQWRGADLVFDIDADHFDIPCQKEHDKWSCSVCSAKGKGPAPAKCPHCDAPNTQIRASPWLCENCLTAAKAETVKLVEDFLLPDFGLSKEELLRVFSGQRGYHVHVHNKDYEPLGSLARREIIDYVIGNGIKPEYLGLYEIGTRPKIIRGPSPDEGGWRGRLARAMVSYLQTVTVDDLKKIQTLESVAQTIYSHRSTLLDGIRDTPSRYAVKGIKIEHLNQLAIEAARHFGCKIDVSVTGDVHRLIRLPDSLHGKTGFRVVPLAYGALSSFDPFNDALVFSGATTVYVREAPPFRIGPETYPALKDQTITLPTSAAVFLMARGVAVKR